MYFDGIGNDKISFGRIVGYWRVISKFKQHNNDMLIYLGPLKKDCSISELDFHFLNNDYGDYDTSIQLNTHLILSYLKSAKANYKTCIKM
jgi:hypothetical protein